MRERNSKFLNNIGDLMEEINIQDLEEVNGGKDAQATIVYPTMVTIDQPCTRKTVKPQCIELPVFSINNCTVDK